MNKQDRLGVAYNIAASCMDAFLDIGIIEEACQREGCSKVDAEAIKQLVKDEIITYLLTMSKHYKRQSGLAEIARISEDAGLYD